MPTRMLTSAKQINCNILKVQTLEKIVSVLKELQNLVSSINNAMKAVKPSGNWKQSAAKMVMSTGVSILIDTANYSLTALAIPNIMNEINDVIANKIKKIDWKLKNKKLI